MYGNGIIFKGHETYKVEEEEKPFSPLLFLPFNVHRKCFTMPHNICSLQFYKYINSWNKPESILFKRKWNRLCLFCSFRLEMWRHFFHFVRYVGEQKRKWSKICSIISMAIHQQFSHKETTLIELDKKTMSYKRHNYNLLSLGLLLSLISNSSKISPSVIFFFCNN